MERRPLPLSRRDHRNSIRREVERLLTTIMYRERDLLAQPPGIARNLQVGRKPLLTYIAFGV